MPNFTEKLKKQVRERDELIGCWYPNCLQNWSDINELDVHHRRNRGMGGSKEANVLSNLILLCNEHNTLIEQDSYALKTAVEVGIKLPRNNIGQTVHEPIQHPYGLWVTLDDKGGIHAVQN